MLQVNIATVLEMSLHVCALERVVAIGLEKGF